MPRERAKMLAGELYDPTDPELVAEREAARERCRQSNQTAAPRSARRDQLLRKLFGTVGEGAFIEPPFRCDYGEQISVGDAFFANFGCVFLDVCSVGFGDRCMLGPGVQVGDRSVVASGAVVTRDVPADVVVRGNPADVVKQIE